MARFNSRTIATALTAATLVAAMVPASANAASRHHDRYSAQDARYVRAAYAAEPRYETRRVRAEREYRVRRGYVAEPVYAASPFPSEPLLYPIGGAVIGAIIGAAVCPPCSIAGSALTSGGGALIGGGIGAIGGTLVGVAVSQPQERYVRF